MVEPSGGIFTYEYDPASQLDGLLNPQGDRTTLTLDAASRLDLLELANGTVASYS